jgi:hypothetical protein
LDATLEQDGISEIVRLHAVFDGWLSGRAAPDGEALRKVEAALGPTFSMVPPNGRRLDRAGVIGWLAGAHGSRGAAFRIWIEEAALIIRHGDTAIFSYDECQHMDGKDTRRKATVVFALDKWHGQTLPRNLIWLAVHETWVA